MSAAPLSVLILTSTPPEEVGQTAALVEQLGFGQVWVAEDYFFHGGVTAAAAALRETRTIQVGLGVIAAVARHPAVTAMEVASLARCHPGRFSAGIGHGLPAWTEQMGLRSRRPLGTLEECVTAVRALLAGETVSAEGRTFTLREVRLTHPPTTEVPLLTGVVGPRSLELSGRIADGTILSALASPAYVRESLGHIRAGQAAAGRDTAHQAPVFALTSIGPDSATARAAVRPVLAFYLAAFGPVNPLTGALGWTDKLTELLEGGVDHLAAAMPEEWVDQLAVAGDPTEAGERIRALLDAGATSVVLSPVDPANQADELSLVAKTLL